MGIVAVAGGTGGLGRALVEAIAARGKHEVKILSRKSGNTWANELNVPIIAVDYNNIEGLAKVLEDNSVDTVISALGTLPTEGAAPELNLVRAAEASNLTRRFIASNWVAPLKSELMARVPSTAVKAQTIAELKKTSLEYTAFYNGIFLDYYSTPVFKSYMHSVTIVVDLPHNMAAIPGSGNTPVTFTHTFDLGKYADRVLDLEKWEPEYYIVGDQVTWNEFVKIAEESKGVKFNVVYDSIEELEKGNITELPSVTESLPLLPVPKEVLLGISALFGLIFDGGAMNFSEEETINKQFPDIKPLGVKEALKRGAKALQ